MCCALLAENTERKNYAKHHHLRTIAQLCRAISSQRRHRKSKKVLDNNISSTCARNMVNFGPLTAEIVWRVLGTPINFNGFRVLASLLHRRHSTEVNQTLHENIQMFRSRFCFLVIQQGNKNDYGTCGCSAEAFGNSSIILYFWQLSQFNIFLFLFCVALAGS